MQYLRALILLPILAACATGASTASDAARILDFCEAHDALVRALAPQAARSALTHSQVLTIDKSIQVADLVCTGTVPNYSVALTVIESEVMRLTIMQEAD